MNTPASSLDLEIRERCTSGDYRRAATLILEAYGTDLVCVIHARFRDEQQTSEVFSLLAEDLWLGLPGFSFRCSVRAWMFTLARNAGSRYLKRDVQRARNEVPLSQVPELNQAVTRICTQTFDSANERDLRLQALRAELSEEEQVLLMLRIDRALDFREIAVATLGDIDADEQAVTREAARLRKRFQAVKDRMRKRWADLQ